jgi:pilus assembly protein CpaE
MCRLPPRVRIHPGISRGMDTWIIFDDQTLATRVANALNSLKIDCPTSRAVDISTLEHFTSPIATSGDLVILSLHQLVKRHLGLLRELRQSTDATLVVVSAIPDHATVLSAIRAGADDYVNSNGVLESELSELMLRLRENSADTAAQGQLLTIVPCYSTPDSSFLAANLAALWATKHGSCALLDFHLRGGVLALMLKLTPRHTLLDLIQQRQGVDRSMLEQALARHESGIRLLAGPDLFSDLQGVQTQGIQQILDVVTSMEQHVIVDVEDLQHAEQVRALAKSDKVVLVMRLDLISLYVAQQHLEYLAHNGVSRDHIQIVALGTGHSSELPVASVKEALSVNAVHCIPDDPTSTVVSLNLGNPLVLETPKSKTTRALTQLADALSGEANPCPQKKKARMSFWKGSAILAGPSSALEQ